MKNNDIPNKRNSKTDQDRAGDLIDTVKVRTVSLLLSRPATMTLPTSAAHIHQQADRKDNDPFLQRMGGRKGGGVSQPEKDNAGIKGIDDKARGKDPGHIPFPKPLLAPPRSRQRLPLF